MGSRPPSRTIANATLPGSNGISGVSAGVSPGARRGGARLLTASSALLIAVTLVATVFAGCSQDDRAHGVPAAAHDRLEPGITYSADLDGDDVDEQVVIDGTPATLTISDGDVVYRSRDRWQIVQAHLGDTDRDGLLEIVTLVDDDEGRHIGLFAYYRGEYRERLVSSEIVPRPVALEVVGPGSTALDPAVAATLTGDAVLLTLEAAAGQTGTITVLCRWNGFSFTGIEHGP